MVRQVRRRVFAVAKRPAVSVGDRSDAGRVRSAYSAFFTVEVVDRT